MLYTLTANALCWVGCVPDAPANANLYSVKFASTANDKMIGSVVGESGTAIVSADEGLRWRSVGGCSQDSLYSNTMDVSGVGYVVLAPNLIQNFTSLCQLGQALSIKASPQSGWRVFVPTPFHGLDLND